LFYTSRSCLGWFSAEYFYVDLEKIFLDFKDHESVIRWINDTVAIAVFQSPSLALKARKGVACPFMVEFWKRMKPYSVPFLLEPYQTVPKAASFPDCVPCFIFLDCLPILADCEYLEPSRRRPQTSDRAEQRMIAQSMGLKMPSSFGSTELRERE
ncbi:hypothetical protein AKJ16_DCAP04731, partial [Drosera capensis]